MVNDGGNENGKINTQTKKKTTCLISNNNKNNNNFARAANFNFFCISLSLSCTTTARNFLVTRFMEGTSHVLTKNFVSCVPARFVFHCRSFSPYWPLKFFISIFKFDCFFVSVLCFISRSSPFSVKTRLCCCFFFFF